MNFPGEASEETSRLKKQIQQQSKPAEVACQSTISMLTWMASCPADLRLSHLQAEKQKDEAQLTTTLQELRSLQQRHDAGESRIVQLETENAKIKEDRERQRLAHSNLEQAYQTTKTQLQGKEKDKRLLDNDLERTLERRAKLAEVDAETAREKCRLLEEQLRSAQASDRFHDTARRKSGESETTITALQNEIAALKASLLEQGQHPSLPGSSRAGGHSRRPRSSSVSGSSSSDLIQLRESFSEAVKEVEQLKARATKAEREALKASNEKLASSKLSETTIADLKSKVADLNDEVSFQRDNVLKKLEDEVRTLQGDRTRAFELEADLEAARSTSLQQGDALKAARDSIVVWQETADHLQAEVAHFKEEGSRLKEELEAAEQSAKHLQRRNREVESAKKRISKLSKALRKVLVTVTSGQVAGDETQSQSVLAVDETTFANMTSSNDYEADLLDELDQLLGYVDEADGRVEFAKVERGIQESNAVSQRQEMEKIIQLREKELAALTEDRDQRIVELNERTDQLRQVDAQRSEIEIRLQEAVCETQAITSDNETLHGNVALLQQKITALEAELDKTVENSLVLSHTIKVLESDHSETQRQLAEAETELRRSQEESDSLGNHIAILEERLQTAHRDLQAMAIGREETVSQVQNLQAERENLASQYSEATCAINGLQRKCQEGELHAARLAVSISQLEMRLHHQAGGASQREAAVLEQSKSALHNETQQWITLVAELRGDIEESLSHLHSKERMWMEETDRQRLQMAAVEAEVSTARDELQERKDQIETLQLDLQASRTNQQLAEDALRRFVPSRESDLTVVEELSSLDVSTEANELRIQLDQSIDALESSRRIQKARESDLAAALEETKELKSELDRLDGQLTEAQRQREKMATDGQELQARLLETEALNCELKASLSQLDGNLCSTMRQLTASQNKIGELERALQSLEMEKKEQRQQSEAVSEELKEAQEGYQKLKGLMEARNAEYWEVKEELAEWQERFEKSQSDVKIKDELEERLREATTEVQDAKALAEEYLTKCAVLEEKAAVAKSEIEQRCVGAMTGSWGKWLLMYESRSSRCRYDSLESELEQSRGQTAKLEQVEQQLGAASALIEQLEHDLAQKAQECEDADDKELALRKDNKKLGARVAALQARIDKLQLQGSAVKATAPLHNNKASMGQMKESGSAGSLNNAVLSPAGPPSASRKRRAPEDEEQAAQSQSHPAVTTRAIYAPKLVTSLVKEVSTTTKPSSSVQLLAVQRNIVKKDSSSPPSVQVASKVLKSPKKGPSATLQDRTNLLQSRQAETATMKDTHFLTKLNRFRPPSSINVEATPVAPS